MMLSLRFELLDIVLIVDLWIINSWIVSYLWNTKMPSWRSCTLCWILTLAIVTIAMSSTPPAWFEPVTKQLYCDVINSYWAVDAVDCCIQCEREIDVCEGVSVEKDESSSIYMCKVCLVKAVSSPMAKFTVPTYGKQIYRRIIDTQKGKSGPSQRNTWALDVYISKSIQSLLSSSHKMTA